MTNLIVFPPSFLLLQLFRRSRKRVSKSKRLRKILHNLGRKQNENLASPTPNQEAATTSRPNKQPRKQLTFPWWFKIFAYVLALALAAVSGFFIIIRGITFGQERVSQWLTSLVVSVATSILLTQPLQVRKDRSLNKARSSFNRLKG